MYVSPELFRFVAKESMVNGEARIDFFFVRNGHFSARVSEHVCMFDVIGPKLDEQARISGKKKSTTKRERKRIHITCERIASIIIYAPEGKSG